MTDVMSRSGDRRGSADAMSRQSTLIGDLAREVEHLQLHRFTATERLSEPFTLMAEVVVPEPVDFLPHLGLSAGVIVDDVEAVRRRFLGRLFEVRYLSESDLGNHYQLTVKPWFSLLDLNLNTRAFQDQSAIEVVKKVLAGQKFRVSAAGTADQPRGYCNQYRESDFAFVSRLLEEDGYFYYFDHTESGEEMVICANQAGSRTIPGLAQAEFHHLEGVEARALSFWEWTEAIKPVPQKVTLHDTHHLWRGAAFGPDRNEKAGDAAGGGPAHRSELFDYPSGAGGAAAEGQVGPRNTALAELRLQSARAEQRRFSGEGDLFAIAVGAKIGLSRHHVEAWNQDYLIIGATHALSAQTFRSGGGGGELLCTVEAIPFATPYRPALKTPKPVVAGPTTAVVIGPDGEDVHVDETGRVKVQFSWDRRAPDGGKQNLGIWIRVSQGWAGGGYGLENIPRMGTEVIVDFVDGDPDLPVITGRLHAHGLVPPLSLPGEKTKSTWKSQTLGQTGRYPETEEPPSGVGFNEIRLEDKGGEEEVFIHAQRLRKDWTRFDENHKVGHDFVERVGRDRSTEIKRHETLVVEEGDETHTVKMGSRKTKINKLDDLKVETGDQTTEVSMGNQDTKVKMGNITVKADLGKIEIEAMQSIELKVGSSSVKIDQTGVTIKGMMIKTDATAMAEFKSGAMTTLDGGGITIIKGGMVMIN